jgi:hypothetical protein
MQEACTAVKLVLRGSIREGKQEQYQYGREQCPIGAAKIVWDINNTNYRSNKYQKHYLVLHPSRNSRPPFSELYTKNRHQFKTLGSNVLGCIAIQFAACPSVN